MLSSVKDRSRAALMLFPAVLARLGFVDREKGSRAFDLAVPVMVTGGMRTLLRVADFFMVGVALGDSAVAALEFGFQYYFIPFGLALALTSGTISVVSRFKGADEHRRADFAIKQSLWLALLVSIPITATTWVYAEPLIDLLTNDARAIELGAVYLRIVMLVSSGTPRWRERSSGWDSRWPGRGSRGRSGASRSCSSSGSSGPRWSRRTRSVGASSSSR